MEIWLVYRILRKISDWTLVAFYSEVYVNPGRQNVPKDAPVIITSSHHNEVIDVATLAATMPHRHKISFWAKSTTFSHPVLGPILSSSGAIPVRRNPNKADSGAANNSLFDASTAALARNQVIGVFPEGTSYTEPSVAQILSGAAWAALEFLRSQHASKSEGKVNSAVIIPVGIVYTNKSKFRSRVHVEYGSPIDMASYMPSSMFDTLDAEAERLLVKAVMEDVEEQLRKMTINAPDWDTLYAAQMTRDILWGDERQVKLKDWVVVGQTLVQLLSPPPSSDDVEVVKLKRALTKYFSLLHYTNISNAHLAFLLPDTNTLPTRLFFLRFTLAVLRTGLNPSFLLFLPSLIAHIPAYLFAGLASRYLAPPGEEESQAQFKAILGGIGVGLGTGTTAYWLTKLAAASKSLLLSNGGIRSKLFLWFFTAWILVKWHRILVDRNYTRYNTFSLLNISHLNSLFRFQRLSAAWKVLLGLLQPQSWNFSAAQLAPYEIPPIPAANPFIKRNEGSKVLDGRAWLKAQPRRVPSRSLIIPLLLARRAAVSELASYFRGKRSEEQILKELGAVVPIC
ncbi:hypothetical protein B0H10DRAFT_1143530 [Mycena sp. CBHHK59/15]|nr:hypothetical protein B0H10DRAFT_1143530 [Mycena sp. CBHHK59/15]